MFWHHLEFYTSKTVKCDIFWRQRLKLLAFVEKWVSGSFVWVCVCMCYLCSIPRMEFFTWAERSKWQLVYLFNLLYMAVYKSQRALSFCFCTEKDVIHPKKHFSVGKNYEKAVYVTMAAASFIPLSVLSHTTDSYQTLTQSSTVTATRICNFMPVHLSAKFKPSLSSEMMPHPKT